MKSYATVAIAALCASSAAAAPVRKRTASHHKSVGGSGRVQSDESYDPYLGIDAQQQQRQKSRELESISMSISLPMEPTPTPGTPDAPTSTGDAPSGGEPDGEDGERSVSGAMAAGTTVSALAAAGAMLLL